MSFLVAEPELVTAAAGNLADIGATIEGAHAAAAARTTAITAAAADDVSLAIAQTFGTYGQQFHTLSADAAAFHSEFVTLLNGGAGAYLSAELANAELSGSAAASTPILGGLLGGSGSGGSGGGLLGGLLGGGGGSSGGLLGGLLGGGTGGGILGGLLGPLNSGFNQFSSLFNPNAFLKSLTALTGPINLGNLTPGISLTSGPFAPLAPTLNGIGLDLGSFFSNELANGVTPSNLLGAVTGLFQDVPTLQGLQPLLNSLLPGLFGPAPSTGPAPPAPNPYVVLFDNTVTNLNLISTQFIDHPFPVLNQIYHNQNAYAHTFWNGVALDLQGFPANVPENIQLFEQGSSSFNPAALGQTFVHGITGYAGITSSALDNVGTDIQQTLPAANGDIGRAGTAIQAGNYYGAVEDAAHAPLDLFITGFDTSHLTVGVTAGSLFPLPPTLASITIGGPIGLEGPAGALLPILTATGQQAQGVASLVPFSSIPGHMLGNFANAVGALTNAGVSANFAVNIGVTGATLAGTAMFGLPLQLGFAVLGAPFAGLDGFAQGATAFGAAAQTGNVLGMLNAVGDMPAYVLNGALNGQLLVDLPLPIAVDGLILPAVAHVPFDGILTPQQPLTVTIPVDALGITIPINATLGGTSTQFGGLMPTLINTIPEAIAEVMTE
jgi:hypothetical protein